MAMAIWKSSRPKPVELAETSAPTPVVKQVVAPSVPSKKLKTELELLDETGDEAINPKNKGFDPYNSGAFNFKDTWARVDRKK